jgi:hypothetical protein
LIRVQGVLRKGWEIHESGLQVRALSHHVPRPLSLTQLHYAPCQLGFSPFLMAVSKMCTLRGEARSPPSITWSLQFGDHCLYIVAILQLWALGRTASIEELKKEDPSFEYVSAGDVPLPRTPEQQEEPPRPRPLTKGEIAEYVQLYATAASNAVERAGFDGVEIHGANHRGEWVPPGSVPEGNVKQPDGRVWWLPREQFAFRARSGCGGDCCCWRGARWAPAVAWLSLFGSCTFIFRSSLCSLCANSIHHFDRQPG